MVETSLKHLHLLLHKLFHLTTGLSHLKIKKFCRIVDRCSNEGGSFNSNDGEYSCVLLKAAKIERIVATSTGTDISYKDFVSEGRLMTINRNLADSLTKDAASWIVETVGEGRQYKVTKDSYQFYLERRTTVPVLEQKETPKPEPTAYKPEPAKLPETGSQGSEWLIATGLMAALTAYGLSKKKD